MVKKWAMVFGIVFVVIGLLGFIANPIVGREGIFQTNALHDLVHIISGIVMLVVAMKSDKAASSVLVVFGIVYLLVTILGFLGISLGLNINPADNWLHLVLAVVFLVVGYTNKPKMMAGGM